MGNGKRPGRAQITMTVLSGRSKVWIDNLAAASMEADDMAENRGSRAQLGMVKVPACSSPDIQYCPSFHVMGDVVSGVLWNDAEAGAASNPVAEGQVVVETKTTR